MCSAPCLSTPSSIGPSQSLGNAALVPQPTTAKKKFERISDHLSKLDLDENPRRSFAMNLMNKVVVTVNRLFIRLQDWFREIGYLYFYDQNKDYTVQENPVYEGRLAPFSWNRSFEMLTRSERIAHLADLAKNDGNSEKALLEKRIQDEAGFVMKDCKGKPPCYVLSLIKNYKSEFNNTRQDKKVKKAFRLLVNVIKTGLSSDFINISAIEKEVRKRMKERILSTAFQHYRQEVSAEELTQIFRDVAAIPNNVASGPITVNWIDQLILEVRNKTKSERDKIIENRQIAIDLLCNKLQESFLDVQLSADIEMSALMMKGKAAYQELACFISEFQFDDWEAELIKNIKKSYETKTEELCVEVFKYPIERWMKYVGSANSFNKESGEDFTNLVNQGREILQEIYLTVSDDHLELPPIKTCINFVQELIRNVE